MIYFDYAATTPIDDEVLKTYLKIQKNFFANTTSLHKLGQESNFMFEKAKKEILTTLNLSYYEIVFTSNATEANNLGIYGVVKNSEKGKIITSKIEHASVHEVIKNLENEGYDVVFLDVDKNGIIDLEQLRREIDKNTLLVSIMWVNNVVGSIQPIQDIINIVREYPKTKLHIDIVQGLCKIKPNFNLSDIDLMTFSTHKIYGPKGIGCLLYRQNIDLYKRLFGSNAQNGVKPGTLDLALIVATTKAIKKFYPLVDSHYSYVKRINNLLREFISKIETIIINSPENASPYIFNISIPNINGETVVHMLEEKKIYVSTGSACSSKLKKPERTVFNMTGSKELASTTIRISLSHLTTDEDIIQLVDVLKKV